MIRALEAERAVDHHEVRFRRLDGSLVWVDISLRLLDFNDEPAILSAMHDITERKAAEERLQQQVEALRLELEETSKDTAIARSTGTTRFENLDAAVIERGSTELIAVHSFRGGNGKSSITANVAALLAVAGQRVGVIDADIQSPGLHLLLGQRGQDARATRSTTILLGNCAIDQLAVDVTAHLGQQVAGRLFLIPASLNPGTMAQVLSQGYDAQRLTRSFHELGETLGPGYPAHRHPPRPERRGLADDARGAHADRRAAARHAGLRGHGRHRPGGAPTGGAACPARRQPGAVGRLVPGRAGRGRRRPSTARCWPSFRSRRNS